MARPQIGIYEKALPDLGGWPARMAAAAEAGFDFLEIAVDETDERLRRLDWSPADRVALRRAASDGGVGIHAVILSAHRRFPLGSASRANRKLALDIFDKAVGLAVDIGARAIQLAGYYVYYEPHDGDSRERFVDGLHRGLEKAGAAGVMLGLETMDGEDVTSVERAMEIVDEIGSPWLQVYPDIGNLAANGLDVGAELRRAKGHLVGIHLKDARPGEYRRVPFGEGVVPFVDAFRALAEIGYDGTYLIEMWNDDAADSLRIISDARVWIQDRMVEAGLAMPEEFAHAPV